MSDRLRNSSLSRKRKKKIKRTLDNLPKSGAKENRLFLGVSGGVVLAVFLWSYWPTIIDLWNIWRRSDEYSSGLLVPFLAIYIAWSRRAQITQCRIKPSLWGLFFFLAAQFIRYLGLYFMYDSGERLSLVISLGALVLLLFGWRLFGKVITILIFLGLMLPLPRRLEATITLPLQQWATASAVFFLEVLIFHY